MADWITVPRAAELLGVEPHTAYRLIERGELEAESIVLPGPKRKGQFRVARSAVDDYLARARVRPGSLRHLYRN